MGNGTGVGAGVECSGFRRLRLGVVRGSVFADDDDDCCCCCCWVGSEVSSSESELLEPRAESAIAPIVNLGCDGTVMVLCEGGEGVWTVKTGTGVAVDGVEEVRRGIRGSGFPALLLSRRVKLIVAERGGACERGKA